MFRPMVLGRLKIQQRQLGSANHKELGFGIFGKFLMGLCVGVGIAIANQRLDCAQKQTTIDKLAIKANYNSQ